MVLLVSSLAAVLLVQSVAWLGGERASARERRWAIAVAPLGLIGVAGGLGTWLMRWASAP